MKWISVYKRKPKPREEVLIYGNFDDEQKKCIRIGFRVENRWYLHDWKSSVSNFYATRWMRLPHV